LAQRPAQQKLRYIVLHDTEGSYDSTIAAVRNPAWGASWHYTIRSSDGHIAQHIKHRDAAWQAGNWYVNATSIGIEHEGRAAAQGAWYTETMYRASAKLVHYLASRYEIPLDRAHILGHDNVPGITPSYVKTMHWDPGPYWDWQHYFDLLGAPLPDPGAAGSQTAASETVIINPDYAGTTPAFVNCASASSGPCPEHGASAVVLHSAPSEDSPLVVDLGLHPDGNPSTMTISDTGARVSAGQRYAMAGRSGDWIAIWYLGQKAWFHNPASARVAVRSSAAVAMVKPGKGSIPVYGRAYPEGSAYPATIPYQPITPLQYEFLAGQRYTVAGIVPSEYYRAKSFDGSSPGDRTLVTGTMRYVQIQFGHRMMFVDARDVIIVRV
ncbi:MAG: N-acetylmuramoyl-L-alanine amidase, partial [Micromonosporaceae bacterium]|nr:N-acetylmuramoyl-L-alanine amidase [Micromonosporaceae bacterium]